MLERLRPAMRFAAREVVEQGSLRWLATAAATHATDVDLFMHAASPDHGAAKLGCSHSIPSVPRSETPRMSTHVVTGTSSGIGLELTKQILAMDDTVVYATVRTRKSSASGEDAIGGLAATYGDRLKIVEGIDIAEDACKAKLAAALEGVTVDVLIRMPG